MSTKRTQTKTFKISNGNAKTVIHPDDLKNMNQQPMTMVEVHKHFLQAVEQTAPHEIIDFFAEVKRACGEKINWYMKTQREHVEKMRDENNLIEKRFYETFGSPDQKGVSR